ncbi:DMT family transporter [soil metagenome]
MLCGLWTEHRRAEIPKAPPHSFLVLATLLWAGNFVVGGPLAEVLPPFGLNFLRWCVACAVLVPLAFLYEGTGFIRPALRMWRSLLAMAVTGVFLFNALVYLALTETTSINAALINGTTPILTLFVVTILGGGLPTGARLFGSGVCLAGVVWVVSRGSFETLASLSLNRGDLLMLFAALCWAFYTVLGGNVTREISPLAATTVSAILALPFLALFGGYELLTKPVGDISAPVISGLLYIGIGASIVAFLSWNVGIKGVGAAKGAIFLNLIPVITAAIAVPVLGESLVFAQLAGGLLVFAGVTIVSRSGDRKTSENPPPASTPPE